MAIHAGDRLQLVSVRLYVGHRLQVKDQVALSRIARCRAPCYAGLEIVGTLDGILTQTPQAVRGHSPGARLKPNGGQTADPFWTLQFGVDANPGVGG
jgi:hypothetical protein